MKAIVKRSCQTEMHGRESFTANPISATRENCAVFGREAAGLVKIQNWP
jgi:hypothetical protein